ncbi:hypothetical protein [Paenibacillus harenae]|uniref:Holin n=1 Tax=Paenibacillus harenae TaxID=306543 RepID=A0ABT9U4D7_PAEHA|nr:hypothetical protein [Paenibacillus harenae]MDQ0062598.1 hypothetical protein [Paenibacillus harenae]MDQ0114493.1 hypothetical protein [Paenibacillus harenae]
MIERIIILLLAYGSISLYDRSHLKSVSNKAEKAVYIVLMLASLYLAIDYALASPFDFPGLYDTIDLVFTDLARLIDKWLTAPKQ